MTGEEIKKQVYDAVACDDMFYRPELRDAIYDMVDENAKLRELVRALDWCTENFGLLDRCGRCPLDQSSKIECEREVIMHKLGIEVSK